MEVIWVNDERLGTAAERRKQGASGALVINGGGKLKEFCEDAGECGV